jgi:hypothetical protein
LDQIDAQLLTHWAIENGLWLSHNKNTKLLRLK